MWLACNCLALLFANPIADQWVEILRNAQVANATLLERGSGAGRLTIRRDAGRPPVQVSARFCWKGGDFWADVSVEDPLGEIYGFRDEAGRPVTRNRFVYLRSGDTYYSHNPDLRYLSIMRWEDYRNAFLWMHPDALWSRCCPPHGAGGTPWHEMLGIPSGGSMESTSLEFEQVERGKVRQTRRDPDGGRLEVVYSLENAGLPVTLDYSPPAGSRDVQRGEYAWSKLGPAVVLRTCKYERTMFLDDRLETRTYEYALDEVRLGGADDEKLDPRGFLSRLPRGTKVGDRIAGRTYRIGGSEEDDRRSARLVEQIRQRGFAKRD